MKRLIAGLLITVASPLMAQITFSGSAIQLGGGTSATTTTRSTVSIPSGEITSSDGEYVTVAAGATQNLLTLSSSVSGTILKIWVCGSSTNGQGVINVYTDQAASPQFTMDQATIGVYSQSINTAGFFQRGSAQTGGATNSICTDLTWPAYFQHGVKVDFVSHDTGSITFFWTVQYTTATTNLLRLYSKGVNWQSRVTGQNLATTNYTFWQQNSNTGISTYAVNAGGTGYTVGDRLCAVQSGAVAGCFTVSSVSGGAVTALTKISAGGGYSTGTGVATYGGTGTGATIDITAVGTNGSGVMAGMYLSGQGATNATWMEADPTIYVDGSGTASYFGPGTEDFLGLGFYFGNGTAYSSPYSYQTHSGVAIENAAIDFLDYNGGFRFNNGINFVWDGTTRDSGRITSTVSFTYAVLWYQ